ncbi:2-amino-4-hydroxy-6-hydroxymethyldihydropteridine diphosphokinase [Gammaproteobacteria bacterium]|nr:2-amino-4-hydroxy-6-hydroxymethyldihydropteridine diphosphokinase [SAR86 cluster bacterium]MDB3880560.1 2-amino-4-hydroxy-6-hydroxymethyldihydropteridine diphosphokinase [Gammaproteobacteria bacterium]
MKETVFISIGSNLYAEKNIMLVRDHLDLLFDVTYSSIYKTPAEGFVGEDFLNSVCKFETEVNPYEIRRILKEIEKDMGRTIDQKGMSNRVIDLDLILYGDLEINDQELEIPSADIKKYKFILEPLAEIAPNSIHPVLKVSYLDLLDHS